MRMTDEEIELAIVDKIDEIKYNEISKNKFLKEVGNAFSKCEKDKESVLDAIDILSYIAKESGWIKFDDHALEYEKI